MKNTLNQFIAIFLVTNIFLASCAVKPPQPVSWNEPNVPPEMSNVESPELAAEPETEALPIPGPRPIPLQPQQSSITPVYAICDVDSEHDCYGDSQSGWRDVYSADNQLLFVEYFFFGNSVSISEIDGKYYLSCSGIGGDQKEVKEGFVNNLKRDIEALRDAEKQFQVASRNAASGFNWAIIGGIMTCGAGIGIAVLTGGWGWAAIGAGCGIGGFAGIAGGGVAAVGSGAAQKTDALEEYKTAENNLRELIKQQCP